MDNTNRLELLITRYEHTLLRAALAILGDPYEAEDAVQDTFLRWLEKQPTLNGEEHEKAWLFTVCSNGCKSRLRSRKRRPTVELLDTYPAPDRDSGEVAEAVVALPVNPRAAVHLFYYEGSSTEEIAKILGQRPGTVRSHLSRARETLRQTLKGVQL